VPLPGGAIADNGKITAALDLAEVLFVDAGCWNAPARQNSERQAE
jgi:hypothetical protein